MYTEINGINLHYKIDGPSGAPWITLSHSLAANTEMWQWQMETLRKYRVLRFDTRGHGQSDATPGPYRLEQLADDLFTLLNALGIEKTHYVGLSMGGMIGQIAAVKDQSRFQSLVLCDTSSAIPAEMQKLWQDRIGSAQKNGMEPLVQPTIDRWFSGIYQNKKPEDVDKIRAMIRSTTVDGFCGCCHAISKLNITKELSTIKLPTLLIVGEDDPGTPVSAHEIIQKQIRGSVLKVLPKALHFSNVEQSKLFNLTLGEFLYGLTK